VNKIWIIAAALMMRFCWPLLAIGFCIGWIARGVSGF
jgi:hypothetical protein